MSDEQKRAAQKAKLLEFKKEEARLLNEFRSARAILERLVSDVSKHNRKFNDFWDMHYDHADELLVRDPINTFEYYLINRPEREEASIETYLPFTVVSKTLNPV